jgi:hypothetical protein
MIFKPKKLMAFGFLAHIMFYFNNIKEMKKYIQNSYDMIVNILKLEGEFLDLII